MPETWGKDEYPHLCHGCPGISILLFQTELSLCHLSTMVQVSLINRVFQDGFAIVILLICIILYINATNITISVSDVNAVLLATISTSLSVLINGVRSVGFTEKSVSASNVTALTAAGATAAVGDSITILGLNAIDFTNLTVNTQVGAFVLPVVASAVTISSHFWLYSVSGLGFLDSTIDMTQIKSGGMHGLSNNQVVYMLTLSLSDAICALLWFVAALYLAIAYGSWNCSATVLLLQQFDIVNSQTAELLLNNFYKVFQLNANTNTTEIAQIMKYLNLTPSLVQRSNNNAQQMTVLSDLVIKLSQSCLTRQAVLGLSAATFLSFICSSSVLIVSATRFYLSFQQLRNSAVKVLCIPNRDLFDFSTESRPIPQQIHDTKAELDFTVPLLFPKILQKALDQSP